MSKATEQIFIKLAYIFQLGHLDIKRYRDYEQENTPPLKDNAMHSVFVIARVGPAHYKMTQSLNVY